MKAILYELHVALSSMDMVHSAWTTIQEVFIPGIGGPGEGICFNSKGYAFKTDEKRYANHKPTKDKWPNQPNPSIIKKFDIDDKDVKDIQSIVNKRQTVQKLGKKLFEIEIYDKEDQ